MYVEKTEAKKNGIAVEILNSFTSLYARNKVSVKTAIDIAYILGSVLWVKYVGKKADKTIIESEILNPNSFLTGTARIQK